ncbi:hypothetical protein [Candidatus Uabimicrobium sp. HlEnr_7]|uniref:hypothetical protein n=1 Tax=Candidatus Uabimicrobium helgolandensis TaxID=3095367 RepID=UPI0035568C50
MDFIFSARCPQKECKDADQINCLVCPNCDSNKFKKCRETNVLTCKNCKTNLSTIPCNVCGTKVKSKEYDTLFSRLVGLFFSLPVLILIGGIITGIVEKIIEGKALSWVVVLVGIFFCIVLPCFLTYFVFQDYLQHRKAIAIWKNEGSDF